MNLRQHVDASVTLSLMLAFLLVFVIGVVTCVRVLVAIGVIFALGLFNFVRGGARYLVAWLW